MTTLTKSIAFAFIAACGVTTGALHPHDNSPAEPPQENYFFCCDTLDSKGKGSGGGCSQILQEHVIACDKVLVCKDGYTNDEGKVTCT